VVDRVTETVAAGGQGDPFDAATVFGPVATKAQYDRVLDFLESARDQGARVTTGGGPARFSRGYFLEPTVLADVTPDMRVAREEIFGPVVTILRYGSLDEAVQIASNMSYGLGGVIFSSDPERALAVADRVDIGSVGINFSACNHNAPFGGRHDSGPGGWSTASRGCCRT
jgi:aldehyde dehydrogenase (NAD+)